MNYTGHKCEQSGIYRTECTCHNEIALSKGDTFPPCGQCKKAVSYTLVRATRT
jgi:hypothetical protein